MTIIKHEIPILEYDTAADAVLMPGHERLALQLPKKAVFAFPGSTVDAYAQRQGAVIVSHFVSATKAFPVYLLKRDNQELCLMQAPAGAPAAVQILDWLFAYGVTDVISTGSCGVLDEMEENSFLVPRRALRDEGTSYHYLPPSRFVEISAKARFAIRKALRKRGLPYTECITWSTDGFFRETKGKIAYRKSEGCSVVEMECSALAACAELRGAVWGELLYTADTLSNPDRYEERGWGSRSSELALEISLDAALNL